MPFAAADIPSIALAQLSSVVRADAELGARATCRVMHWNLDFVPFLGGELYGIISDSVQANTSGLGDWFFSAVAFPEQPDNTEAYLQRHFSEHRAQLEVFRGKLAEKRRQAGELLDELIERHGLDRYRLVGLTSMFCQNVACFALARKLKERNPEIVVAMGGANCEAPMGAVIAHHVPSVDFVFSGPALKTFPRLVRHLVAGEAEECHRIPGVLSRRKLAIQPGDRREIGEELDIDEEVPLDYEPYFRELEEKIPPQLAFEPKLPFETSRGCWWGERSHCTFCGLNGMTMRYRAMQPARAIAFFHDLFARYGSRVSEFKSVDNILPREYLTEVLPHLSPPENASLFYEIKADLKEREMEVLARAKVVHIQPGIEAMATSTLKLMRKGTTSFQNLKFLKYCQLYGVTSFWNLLVGFPNEPEATYQKYYDDLPLLVHLQPPSGVHPVRFDRFSPYHTRAAEYGLQLEPCEFYGMIYPFPAAALADLAYFFIDREYNARYLAGAARWLGKLRERIDYWKMRWHQRDGKLKPELAFKESRGARIVYDSRSGRAVEHRLSHAGLRVLDGLAEHQRLPRLAASLGDLPIAEVERQAASLRQRGLLFEEDGYFMSLVVKPKGDEAPDSLATVRGSDASEQFQFA